MPADSHFQIPRLRTLASHALPAMIESSFIPLGLFYLAMWAAGLWVALIVARITLLWAFVQLSNAAITLWLLFTHSVGTYMLLKTVLSLTLTGLGVAVSTIYFKHSMRRHGIMAVRAA